MMAAMEGQEEEEEPSDSRSLIKIGNWVVLFFGIAIGIVGLIYVIVELKEGDAKEDSA